MTKTAKTVTKITKLSPTHFNAIMPHNLCVTNIDANDLKCKYLLVISFEMINSVSNPLRVVFK